jgi:hypothetical protein
METLQEAYRVAKSNNGAPGIDAVTFDAIEESGRESFLKQIQDELVQNTGNLTLAYSPGATAKRAKWRSCLSACGSVVENSLTPPTLSETPDNRSYRAISVGVTREKPPGHRAASISVPGHRCRPHREPTLFNAIGQMGQRAFLCHPQEP